MTEVAPFGIEIFSNAALLKVEADWGRGILLVDPPRPHPAFATYLVQIDKRGEVVWVKGISREFDDDAYGYQIRSKVDEVAGQVRRRYGFGSQKDFLYADSIWDEPRDWEMSMRQNERVYSYVWDHTCANLPDQLATVYLGASWLSDAMVMMIEYASPRLEAAEREQQEDLSDLL
ncbi:hypothetical protein [Nocardioides marmoribigeumensis]|uniref:Uncharacterized protein n=1 Tax=Nocardioides marmoribigeumensis TaxID=433649 RepID=A0ABU2BY83_9ACTN|nr:hypothetical protein [Nocardioides marmoribigeumensis]MDR7363360.1 hypothetical protein [Nocardioides marmoribigeumensis]